MLAPPEKPETLPEKPAAPEPKRRTVTLTNRSPIRIIEEQWPVIAEGRAGEEWIPNEMYWSISFHVRFEKDQPMNDLGRKYNRLGRTLIHARYEFVDADDEDKIQYVRVGRLLDNTVASAQELWEHMLAVGEELRGRIDREDLRRQVTAALDRCFAHLKPHDE
jgi:hypothetical protein